jgi:hypothetical protein
MAQWWNDADRVKPKLGEKPFPLSFCPLQIPNVLPQNWNHAFAVTSWRLIAWAVAHPDTDFRLIEIVKFSRWTILSVQSLQLCSLPRNVVVWQSRWSVKPQANYSYTQSNMRCASFLHCSPSASFIGPSVIPSTMFPCSEFRLFPDGRIPNFILYVPCVL